MERAISAIVIIKRVRPIRTKRLLTAIVSKPITHLISAATGKYTSHFGRSSRRADCRTCTWAEEDPADETVPVPYRSPNHTDADVEFSAVKTKPHMMEFR